MTGQEKGDLLIQVTAWACLTVYDYANMHTGISYTIKQVYLSTGRNIKKMML